MDSHGHGEQRVAWAVVGGGIGPLLLAATSEGLVNVVFHATDGIRDRALERLASRLGAEPVESPGFPVRPRRYARSRPTWRVSCGTSGCRWTGR
jgi:methylated-DNA-[protein]-cysteine S-methyltransferase